MPVTITEATSNASSSLKKTLVANGWAAFAFSRISTVPTPGSSFGPSLALQPPPLGTAGVYPDGMKIIAINGSPRKDWNTALLLQRALDGAAGMGAQTRLVHLYDLAFTGCTSCFSCKMKGSACAGLCCGQG